MKGKDFLSITDLSPDEVESVVLKAERIKNGETARPMEGMTVALLFEKPSLRTRVSFEVGIRRLGGDCVYLGRDDVGLGVREPVADVARVLDRWVDAVVARVFSHESLVELAVNMTVPVVNALSDLEHPAQAMADLLTIQQHRGGLRGQSVAYIGDGNNTAASLALACASVGADFTIAAPEGYKIAEVIWTEATGRAEVSGSKVVWIESPREAVRGSDVVYTDVWVSMGQDAETEARRRAFQGYQVNEELMGHAGPDAVFMHDMPAHEGDEIAEGMLDHPRSVVFDQAENRLYAQQAILVELLG